ncbi:phosphorylase family protein [Haloarchaeobius amylolyticus]|uniref:phosphorylase family protein n=1 Tax=Haloarchaeobius amylolyticus TaxID=1198296 RepID=UPI00226E7C06|nr:phosphorylase [Haloarchaeobius amylolyticus]
MSIAPAALVLPAFVHDADVLDEREPWLDRYDLAREYDLPGAPDPLRYTDTDSDSAGLALLPTGMGKANTATTLAAALASPDLDLSDTLFLSVGVAGGPPTDTTIGSVVLAEAIVDWDVKVRWDAAEGEGGVPLQLNPYREADHVHRPDPDLLDWAVARADDTDLADDPAVRTHREQYEGRGAHADPRLLVGTNVCGDEFWHGRVLAERVQWLCDRYDAGTYCATEMEDAAAASALARFDRLDDYLSVRGIANFDRPKPGQSVEDSLADEDFEVGFELGLENAVRVASTLVDARLD